MMMGHAACIEAVMERSGSALAPGRQLDVFGTAFNALWQRAQLTLGDVTLMAIVKRVLYKASEHYPVFKALTVANTGIARSELEMQLAQLSLAQRDAALRYVLVEVLTVIGSLTADILTPALHQALLNVLPANTPTVVVTPEETNARSKENGQ
jgi:hypothetical protein